MFIIDKSGNNIVKLEEKTFGELDSKSESIFRSG